VHTVGWLSVKRERETLLHVRCNSCGLLN